MNGIFCTKCGKYSVAGSQFCMSCGARIGAAGPAVRSPGSWGLLHYLVVFFGVVMLIGMIAGAWHHESPTPAVRVAEASPSASSGNAAQDKLLALSKTGQARALAEAAGEGCVGMRAFYRGSSPADHSAFWSVRCKNGKSYQVQVNADVTGSTSVADCDVLRTFAKINCFAKIPGSE